MRIEPDNKNLSYCGRIDWSDKKKPVFVFPCTSVSFRFTGTSLRIRVENRHAYWNNYVGCIVDGKQMALELPEQGVAEYEIVVTPNERDEHEAMVFKRQDACHELIFHGIDLAENGKLLAPPEPPKRRIEVYGDSVSAGEVSEAVEYVGMADPEHNGEYSNSWYSYAWIAARKLGAQIHDIAQGGIALMDDTGWFYEPNAIGMETVWDKLHYNPQYGTRTSWDFAEYTPQVVIAAIGQNDSHPADFMKEDPDGSMARRWKQRYGRWICRIREAYPHAVIILTTTLLQHDAAWDQAIEQIYRELRETDDRIYHLLYSRNGAATPGHLRIPEAEEMAQELCDFIEAIPGEIWV